MDQGLGLAYISEPTVAEPLRTGRPSRAQRSGPPRLFVETAKKLLMKKG